jgi:phosphatidate cytidylyltransferase
MVRLLSGLVLAAAALAAILFLPPLALRVVAVVVAVAATFEYLAIARRMNVAPSIWVAVVLVAAACWWMSVPGRAAMGLLVIAALGLLLVDVLFGGKSLPDASVALVAPVYLGVPLGTLVAVHALGGREAVILLIATVVVSDSAQYYSGRAFGRHALAPAISPKKTIEGAVGGVLFGTLFMVVGGGLVFPFARRPMLLLIGVSVVLLGIAGDLFESRLKRIAGIKDSSTLIPGHGGVLDRIDALLFASPAFYLFLNVLM